MDIESFLKKYRWQKGLEKMENYERCGMFCCGSFGTSLPLSAKGKTLFKEYLRSIGHQNGIGLIHGKKAGIYTIDYNSKNKNTEVDKDGDFDTILIGVRKDDKWEIYELDKPVIEKEGRLIITWDLIEKEIKDKKARQIDVKKW